MKFRFSQHSENIWVSEHTPISLRKSMLHGDSLYSSFYFILLIDCNFISTLSYSSEERHNRVAKRFTTAYIQASKFHQYSNQFYHQTCLLHTTVRCSDIWRVAYLSQPAFYCHKRRSERHVLQIHAALTKQRYLNLNYRPGRSRSSTAHTKLKSHVIRTAITALCWTPPRRISRHANCVGQFFLSLLLLLRLSPTFYKQLIFITS